jgi:hypothetical protein
MLVDTSRNRRATTFGACARTWLMTICCAAGEHFPEPGLVMLHHLACHFVDCLKQRLLELLDHSSRVEPREDLLWVDEVLS